MRTELALPLNPDEVCQFIPDAYKAKKKYQQTTKIYKASPFISWKIHARTLLLRPEPRAQTLTKCEQRDLRHVQYAPSVSKSPPMTTTGKTRNGEVEQEERRRSTTLHSVTLLLRLLHGSPRMLDTGIGGSATSR